MKNTQSLKKLILAAAVALGLAGVAQASEDPTIQPATSMAEKPAGLLGHSFTAFNYGFVNLDDTGVDVHALSAEYNRAVDDGLDTFASVKLARSTSFLNGRYNEQSIGFGGRLYRMYSGVKPFWDFTVGWTWAKAPAGFKEDGFAWNAGIGVEMPVANGLSLTPYGRYGDALDFPDGDSWTYGAKANYWLNERTALTGLIERRHQESTEYRLGVAMRF